MSERGWFMIGNNLSHYKILEKIGQGGMGDVYLAEDTKLSRPVALKVLPSEMAANDSRLERFEREAKAVAALNHPNIVTVHSVEEDGGVHFITMELVRGRNLSQLIPDKGLPLKRFLEIAMPLADAVSAAHRAGITHRDLKPDNVMVTEDDRVKVLDFGLAKPGAGFALADEGSEIRTQARTREGEIVGTPSYMSPEQVEGKAVDPRSDIFSLGILFYEMLAGRRPFTGDTAAAVLSSIMKDTPPPLEEVRSQVPGPLSKIVQRCLAKDPERRLQSAADLRNELQELRTEPATGRSARVWLIAGATLLTMVAVWTYLPRGSEDTVLRLANPRQLTSAIGVEDYPSWSPGGRTVAYSTETLNSESRNWDVWVTQIGSGETVNRTADHQGMDRFPAVSPDGGQIAFWSDRDGGGYYVMSALGGSARRLLADGGTFSPPQWSADGDELACVVSKELESFAEIVSLATGESRLVPLPVNNQTVQRFGLSWSPDGRFFSYVDAQDNSSNAHRLWVTRSVDGKGAPVTPASTEDWSPSWSPDSRTLYYVSNRGGSMDLWQQRIGQDGMADGEPQPITSGLVMRRAAMSPDGTKLAYSKGRRVANIWRVPLLPDRPARWADAEQITFDQALIEFVDVSPDGKRILFSSDRSGNHDIWMMRLEGSELLQVTRDPAGDWYPRWSPDGLSVVFYSQRSGNRDIWVKPLDAGPARQVTHHEADDRFPSWSPDGEKVAFASMRDGNVRQLFVVSIEGGNASRITEGSVSDWSPDGSPLVFNSGGQVFVVDAEAGATRRLVLESGDWSRWSRDGRRIYFKGAGEKENNIWEVRPDASGVRPLTDLVGRPGRIGYEAPSSDGEYLYFIWVEDLGDIWVMDVVEND